MSELDLTGLRKVAEAVGGPEWVASSFGMPGDQEPTSVVIHTGLFDWQALQCGESALAWVVDDWEVAEHIAAFDPATVLALLDRLEAAEAAEDEHDQCPAQCPVCSDWATRTPCDHCKGSGCGPGTALGGYEECEWCAGMGWLHEGCLDTGPSWQERAEAAEAELSNYRVRVLYHPGDTNQGYFLTRESAMGKSHRFIGKEELEQ